ncbi:hypothetical protein [Bacillus sp. 71mf]|uniref:hypothetical protein n=1 Tax=Bacillus sp. 71mf TaxID=1761757 RepID=UPI001587064D|nr:hypothetical protein [Bacillus sp. 71mf]
MEVSLYNDSSRNENIFLQRYHAACHMYIEEHAPKDCADVVVNNNHIEEPVVVFTNL